MATLTAAFQRDPLLAAKIVAERESVEWRARAANDDESSTRCVAFLVVVDRRPTLALRRSASTSAVSTLRARDGLAAPNPTLATDKVRIIVVVVG